MRNTSLDEFLDAGSESEESAEAEAGAAEETADAGGAEEAVEPVEEPEPSGDETPEAEAETPETDDDTPSPEDVEPARATLDFSPGGATCESCDETVERRWRDGDAMVCADCKEW